MTGGMFGGKGTDAFAASDRLTQEASGELRMGRPLRQQAISDARTAMQTGSAPTTQVPLVQRALEQVLMAGSKARTDAESRVAASGIGRTPQGTRILTDVDFMNALQASLVPSQVAQQVVDRGMGVAMGQLTPGLQGLSTAAGVTGGIHQAQLGAEAAMTAALIKAFSDVGSSLASGGAA